MQVELNDVIQAIEEAEDETSAFYDPETGTITWEGDDSLIPLPTRADRGDYRNMERFTEEQEEGEAKEWLTNALVGKGAFRRFRAACEKFHLLQDYYDYEDRCHRGLAIQWCEDNGIVYTDAGRVEEEPEDDVSDFLHENYEEAIEEEPVEVIPQSSPIRLVEITSKNYMNALYITDAFLQEVYHGKSDLDYAEDQLNVWLEQECHIYAASDHGRFVGLAVGKESMEDFTIQAVYVNKDFRRKGIGTMLLRMFEQLDEQAASYRLEVGSNNAGALQFFAKTGYLSVPVTLMRKVNTKE